MLPVPHPGDRSSACVPASLGSPPRRQSTTRSSTPPGSVQTSVRVPWLPCPRAPGLLVTPDRGRTSPLLRGARVAALVVLQFRFGIHICDLLKARMVVTPYNNGSFLPGLGWLEPPKSTRAWEPTLLWNHYFRITGPFRNSLKRRPLPLAHPHPGSHRRWSR
jgi:hypothetical protein